MAIVNIYANNGGDEQWPFVYTSFQQALPRVQLNMINGPFAVMAGRVTKSEYAQQGIAAIKDFGVKYKSYGFTPQVIAALNEIRVRRGKLNDNNSVKMIDDAIKQISETK